MRQPFVTPLSESGAPTVELVDRLEACLADLPARERTARWILGELRRRALKRQASAEARRQAPRAPLCARCCGSGWNNGGECPHCSGTGEYREET